MAVREIVDFHAFGGGSWVLVRLEGVSLPPLEQYKPRPSNLSYEIAWRGGQRAGPDANLDS